MAQESSTAGKVRPFKCIYPDCNASFRKQCFLEAHVRHYQHYHIIPKEEPNNSESGTINNPTSNQKGNGHKETRTCDFGSMFSTLDSEIIETVLRANKGAVDATVDQLLEMCELL